METFADHHRDIQHLLEESRRVCFSDLQASIRYAEQACIQARQLPDHEHHPLYMESLLELATLWQANSEFSKSFEQILQIRSLLKYYASVSYTIRAHSLLASIQIGYADYIEAIATLHFAQELARGQGDKASEAEILSKIGLAYGWLGEFKETFDYLHQALALHEQAPMDSAEATILLNNLAYTYVVIGQPENGRVYAQRAFEIARETQNITGQVLVLGTQGEIEVALGEYEAAEACFQESDQITQVPGREKGRSEYLRSYANYNNMRGHYDAAIKAYEECLLISKNYELKSVIPYCLSELVDLYERQGDYALALDSAKRYNEVTDALYADRITYRMGIQKDLYQQELLRQENQALAEQNELSKQGLRERDQSVYVQQQLIDTITEIATPVLPLLPSVYVMPLIGSFSDEQVVRMQSQLLHTIEQQRVRVVILDITGLPLIDTQLASTLIMIVQAAQLLGCKAILVGIRPEVAQSLVGLGISMSQMSTSSSLADGLRTALATVGYKISKNKAYQEVA